MRSEVQAGEAVGIVGVGGVGHLAVQFAMAVGYRVVAVDSRKEGCELAADVPKHLKPNLVVNPSEGNADEKIREFTNNEGLGGIIVCTDSLQATSWGLSQLGNKGCFVPLGLPKEKYQFDAETIIFRELTIKGTYVASAEDVREMLKVVADHGILSHLTILSFDGIPGVVDRYLDASIKGRLVVQIDQSS